MKSHRLILAGFASLFSAVLFAGCTSTDYGHTSPYHPGPVVGKTVGNAAGVVAGNAVGLGVGTVEGVGCRCCRAIQSELSHGAPLAHGNHFGWPHDSSAV